MITHQSVIATCHSKHACWCSGVTSDDLVRRSDTYNHFFMILCAGLQVTTSTVYLTKRPDCCIEVWSRPIQWTTVMSWWLLYRCFIAICKCFWYWNCSRKTFWSPEMWLLEGPRGASKKFSRLAIARHILRPPRKLCCNSTTDSR